MTSEAPAGFCRALSVLGGESMVATAAAETSLWLVLEYCGTWAAKAYAAADLPAVTRASIDRWSEMLPGTRVQLIRNERTRGEGPFVFYVGWSGPSPGLVELRLDRYEDLAEFDVPAIAEAIRSGRTPEVGVVPDRPVVLVCTNGKRDRCCAKWGTPVYQRARNDPRIHAWQTTHLGGHRFAATLVVLPEGLCYGRLEPQDMDLLITSHGQGRVSLDHLRGRTSLPSAGQAAEHFLREELGELQNDAVTLRSLDPVDAGPKPMRWRAVLGSGGRAFELELRQVIEDRVAPSSCGDEPSPITSWVAESIRSV